MTEETARIEVCAPERDGPTLSWPGKRLCARVDVPRLHTVESFGAANDTPNLLLHGDNLSTLAWLLANGYRGQIRLIYIDPPFDSDGDYTSVNRLRGQRGEVFGSRVQYRDRRQDGDYLQFMAERLLLLKELLHPNGTLWLHCDHRASTRLQLLLEEIFGAECYLNTIAWRSQVARGAKVHAHFFPRSTHSIHIFAATAQAEPTWHPPRREIEMTRAEAATHFMEDERGFFRTSHPGSYRFETLVQLHAQGRIYAPHGGEVIIDDENRRVYASNGGNIGVKYYVERRGRDRFVVTRAVDNLWDDIPGLGTIPSEDVNYPTQKTEGLLQRVLETASETGDWVLDAFAGSGTSLAMANKLARRWIGCDDNWGSIRTTAGRIYRAGTPFPLEIRRQDGHPTPSNGITATVHTHHEDGTLHVRVDDVRSAAVLSQLSTPPVDWRAAVQSIAVDPAFDGVVFRPQVIDAPAGRKTLVTGEYNLPMTPNGTLAVQIVDVVGNEVVLVE
jgi:DNA modification methylase